ncbi:unnamed protein product [Acanthoscelides obtectus]|uniref:DUF4200 domain-containing protein n=1 Tax=Acanthoscelides obtectus TaxID=200917 RepID=A0A9P0JXS1_ACAOB|nr:unnamed protein product [Acanthoscelides obtectus]CAK1638027.1 Coiled-coil domain-containing protein 42 homolog [Acanthoscelides obtectus]
MSWRQPAWDKICEFTTKPTYDLHDEYMVSKAITDEHPKIHNSGDDVKRDMQTRHCIALGKLTETEARLKAARQFMSKRRVNLDEQWGELTRQEEELRENFIAFSSFIKENDEKCARAKSKINEMLALTSTRATENIQLQKEVEVLQETKTRMDATIKKYYLYEKFLQKVMEAYPDVFKSLNEVIYRYDALMNARGQLETLNEYRLRELEIAKAQFGLRTYKNSDVQ